MNLIRKVFSVKKTILSQAHLLILKVRMHLKSRGGLQSLPLHVLLINSTFGGISGSGRHVRNLVQALKGKVEYVLWNVNSIGYLDFPKLRSITFYLNCVRKSIPKHIDIIHVHNPKFAGLFNKNHINILTIHGDYETELKAEYGTLSKIITWYINVHVRKAHAITTVSPHWATIRKWLWIPNMVNINEIRDIEPANESYMLFVGRDDPIKNYPLFKRIAERAYIKFNIRSLALGIRGTNKIFLKHNVVSWRKVISYMKSAFGLIITSRQEGFPTVILEAWACKCPVIARSIPPIRSLAKINPNTMLLYETIGGALRNIQKLKSDNEFKNKIVMNGAKAVEKYDVRIVAKKYYELYTTLVKKIYG